MINVLVTNDDGIEARGIKALVKALAQHADVYVAAPATEQSAKSHSITFLREVSAEERVMEGAVSAWALDGTPVDCVMWGIGRLESEGITPDYVISGINMGYNTGQVVYYSGTVAGAREGALNGICSIALSIGNHDATHFDYLLGILPRLMEMSDGISPKTVLNVNAPDIESWEVKGLRIAEAAPCGHRIKYRFTRAESGDYQMGGIPAESDSMVIYDYDLTRAGYVAVSPLSTSLADPVALLRLNGLVCRSEQLAVLADPQEGILKDLRKAGRFSRNISKLAHCLDRMNIPVIVTETYGLGERLKGVEEYTSNAELVEHIQPDAWTSPDLQKYAEYTGASEILIAGAKTNVSLLQTALSGIRRGYRVTVIGDCCAASSKTEHKLAIDMLRDAGCTISSCETAVMQLAGSCDKGVREAAERILRTENRKK